MSDAVCHVRSAEASDAEAVADLAAGLAQSFPFSRARFGLSYPALLADDDACLLLAVDGEDRLGYLLGFRHLTCLTPTGPVWLGREEVFVRGQDRARGVTAGPSMSAFERWAAVRDCAGGQQRWSARRMSAVLHAATAGMQDGRRLFLE